MSDSESGEAAAEGADTYSDWSAGELDVFQSLFTSRTFSSAEDVFAFDDAEFGFDLRRYQQKEHLDQYGVIKVINFVRQAISDGQTPPQVLQTISQGLTEQLQSDERLTPILEDDALLFLDYEQRGEASSSQERHSSQPAVPQPMVQDLRLLQDENAALREVIVQLQGVSWLPDATEEDQSNDSADSSLACAPVATTSQHHTPPAAGPALGPSNARSAAVRRADQSYFESYAGFGIHQEMISDKARTDAYKLAIQQCLAARPHATVLDVGCGTSILSMFAAEAGATTVIGIEGSLDMARMAEQICCANRLGAEGGGPISIVAGQVEQLHQLPVQQVDVIVSEWMGYALLFECMLDTVLYARDRWLRPGGAMLPDRASLWVAGAAPQSPDLQFWDDVYGFSMRPVRQVIEAERLGHVAVAPVPAQHILTGSHELQHFDLLAMSARDADFSADFRTEADCQEATLCTAIIIWFDVGFGGKAGVDKSVLSTSPSAPQTHWAQAILTLKCPVLLQKAGSQNDDVAVQTAAGLQGRISFARSTKHRSLDISLECIAMAADGSTWGAPQVQVYDMAGH